MVTPVERARRLSVSFPLEGSTVVSTFCVGRAEGQEDTLCPCPHQPRGHLDRGNTRRAPAQTWPTQRNVHKDTCKSTPTQRRGMISVGTCLYPLLHICTPPPKNLGGIHSSILDDIEVMNCNFGMTEVR